MGDEAVDTDRILDPASTSRWSVLWDRKAAAATLLGTVLTTAAALASGAWAVVIVACGLLLLAAGTMWSWMADTTRRQLAEQLDNERQRTALLEEEAQALDAKLVRRLQDTAVSYLRSGLLDKLKLGVRERASLYQFGDESFSLVGRFAQDPVLAKRARTWYPVDQGCLGAAWASPDEPAKAEARLPDYEDDDGAYVAHCREEWKMPETTTRGIRMKSRHLLAYAIEDPVKLQRAGVLVFESLDEDGLDVTAVDEYVQESARAFGELLNDDFPDPGEAERRDF